jgi:hypothetical protein
MPTLKRPVRVSPSTSSWTAASIRLSLIPVDSGSTVRRIFPDKTRALSPGVMPLLLVVTRATE